MKTTISEFRIELHATRERIQVHVKHLLMGCRLSLCAAGGRVRDDVSRDTVRWLGVIVIAVIIAFFLGVRGGVLWGVFLMFVIYDWDNRTVGVAAVSCLLACPLLLLFNFSDLAERMATWAYYLLLITLILQMVEFGRYPERFLHDGESIDV